MWWKTLSVVLVLYALSVGLLIPLKPGVVRVAPEIATSGQSISLQILGYNSFYTKAEPGQIRVWLEYDSVRAIAAQQVKVLNDTTLEAAFQLPPYLPKGERSTLLTAIVDHPADGVSLLPNALKIVQDTALASAGTAAADSAWMRQPIANLHVIKDFSFPYRNVIYESIRNTYYHVPMWFVLMFLFMASVWNSIRYLGKQDPDYDRKAAGYAEAGLLFGFLGLFTGMVWANYAWGKPWSNDIKQLMTAVALLIYLAYFILRRSFDEPEKAPAWPPCTTYLRLPLWCPCCTSCRACLPACTPALPAAPLSEARTSTTPCEPCFTRLFWAGPCWVSGSPTCASATSVCSTKRRGWTEVGQKRQGLYKKRSI